MQAGLMNTYQRPISSRQTVAWFLSGLLTLSYLLLYLGPIPALGVRWDVFQAGAEAVGLKSKWTLYGLLYTLAMIAGGAYVIRRHGSSRYQLIRTSVVVLVQITFGFSLPIVMKVFGQQEYYFSYFWPLKIEYLYPSTILGQPFLILAWSFLGSLVAFPLLAYFFGKRFYCSWVCGCGGLANTAGEPFRHLSSKSPRAWKVEQVSIYSVLFLALVTTAIVWVNWAIGKQHPDFARTAFKVQDWYGFAIGAIFSGVIGVGFYPLMGTLPHGGAPRPHPEVRAVPHHGEEGHVHLLRELLHLLRDGHRRPPVRHGQRRREARRLRGLRHVRPRLPSGGAQAGDEGRSVQGRNAHPGVRRRSLERSG
ncbi:MAG: hypothetical protein DMF79_04700 [Acidobacteria bacterium]|nr:MAG: hypothetical protein DMF79_04700 [Acidobacteriota bacterium]